MFQFTAFPSHELWIHSGYLHITAGGFPHSDICGSTDICSSPQLFAACHVLLRLPVPRHPPYALFLDLRPIRLSSLPRKILEIFVSLEIAVITLASLSLLITNFLVISVSIVFDFSYSVFKVRASPSRNAVVGMGDSNLRPHAYQACALTS